MAQRWDSAANKQYLYLAWDQFCPIESRFKAALHILDITDETNPLAVTPTVGNVPLQSSACSAPTQEFMANVEFSGLASAGAWYYYRQNTTAGTVDPCKTDYRGQITTSLTFSPRSEYQISSGTFPTAIYPGASMGDYVLNAKGRLPGGFLYPTWAQPVPTAGTGDHCAPCQGTNYQLRVMGNTVLP
jgi:hypothetical protein